MALMSVMGSMAAFPRKILLMLHAPTARTAAAGDRKRGCRRANMAGTQPARAIATNSRTAIMKTPFHAFSSDAAVATSNTMPNASPCGRLRTAATIGSGAETSPRQGTITLAAMTTRQ